MFVIGFSESDVVLTSSQRSLIVDSLYKGFRSSRLVQQKLMNYKEAFDEKKSLSISLSFLDFPHLSNTQVFIQSSHDGKVVELFLDDDQIEKRYGIGYKLVLTPTEELVKADAEEIQEYAAETLFNLAYSLLSHCHNIQYEVFLNEKVLETYNPVIALYEIFIAKTDERVELSFKEAACYEDATAAVLVDRNDGVIKIFGDGVTHLTITTVELLAQLAKPTKHMEVKW